MFNRKATKRFSPLPKILISLCSVCFTLFPMAYSHSAQVTLAWDPNTEPELAGYRLFYREVGQSYDYKDRAWEGYIDQLDNPDQPTGTICNLDDNTIYCFVARAFDTWGNESGDSNEVCYRLPETIIDNGAGGTSFTGYWLISGGANSYGENSLYSLGVLWPEGATYSFEATVSGSYEVFVWWTYFNSRCESVPVEIYDATTLLDIVYLNQKAEGGQWNVLGTYDFRGIARLVIISEGSCTTCADAARFVPVTW